MSTKEYQEQYRKTHRDKFRAYSKKFYKKNKEKLKKKHAEHYANNKEHYEKRHRKNHLKKKYDITIEFFNKLLLNQNGKCAICSIDFKKMKPCVDHCHKTNKVRGLLCRPCNLSLSVVENKDFVLNANKYLEANEVEDKEPLR